MADDVEQVAAALIGVIAKNQKFLVELQSSLNRLVEAGQTINVPETRVDIQPVDLSPLQTAFAGLEKHLAKHDPTEWTIKVIRDTTNGPIRELKLIPGSK